MNRTHFMALAVAIVTACGPRSADSPDPVSAGGNGGAAVLGGGALPNGPTGAGGMATQVVASGGAPTAPLGSGGVPSGGSPPAPACGARVQDPAAFPACTTCTGGRCVSPGDFPSVPVAMLDACGASAVCLPDTMVATKGSLSLPKCTSVLGNEGRCASLCIPLVRSLSSVLPQDVCGTDERCAPCFNPTDGTETGLCRIGCDPGPTSGGIVFSTCCSGRGDCVPRRDIPGPASSSLGPDTCGSGADDLVCVPSSIVKDPTYRFPPCTSSIAVPGVAPGPGVCVPDCVVDSNPLGKFLGAGTCTTPGDKCAPCNDPTGKPTGACTAP